MQHELCAAADLDEQGWKLLSERVRQLEASWRVTSNPDLAALVPASGHPLRLRVLVELIKVDQEMRWKSGQQTRVETYLEQWPELGASPDTVRDLLEAECLTRHVFGQPPSAEELRNRFPGIAERIDLSAIQSGVVRERLLKHRLAAELDDTSAPTLDATPSDLPAAAPLRPGERFGRYEIRDVLGQGGMGTVYRAYDTQLTREVALKIPRLDPGIDPEVRQRFLREAQTAAKIRHPNICTVYDVGEIDGTYYLTMELIEGESLAARVNKGATDPAEAVELVLKVARALAAVHAAGMIHRDIKPSNVMIDASGEPRLTDFGLARSLFGDQESNESRARSAVASDADQDGPNGDAAAERWRTQTGIVLGTLPYLSREQAEGEPVDARSDVYSLGVLLYQLLTGQLPYGGTYAEILAGIRQGQPPPPRSIRSELDEDLQAICLKAMAPAPDNRFTSADLFADALAEYLARNLSPVGRIRRWRSTLTVVGVLSLLLAGVIVIIRIYQTGQLVFEDRFQGDTLNRDLWQPGQMPWPSRPEFGKTSHRIEQQNGSLRLEATAEHEGGFTCRQLAWIDAVHDLRGTEDVTLEIEWSVEANVGWAAIELTDGKDPADIWDSRSIPLLSVSAEKHFPLTPRRQKVQVEISGSAKTATVFTPEGVPRGSEAIGLGSLPAWKLRFLVGPFSSAGYPPARVRADIFAVRAVRVLAASSVSGRVVDTLANRGIAEAVVHVGNAEVKTKPDGSFLLPTAPGKQQLRAHAADYQEVEPLMVTVEPGRRAWVDVPMNRTRFDYGHVAASIPVGKLVEAVAVAPNEIYITEREFEVPSDFFRMSITGGGKVQLGKLKLSPSQSGRTEALSRGSPGLFGFRGGMTWVDGVIYGLDNWPGRIFRVSTTGEMTLLHPLAMDWPLGLVYDGKRFWFLESDPIDHRYGICAIDSQTGQTVVNLPASSGKRLVGLAKGLGRFWVSGQEGCVYEIDMVQALEEGSFEAGVVGQFSGQYSSLGFADGYLWGLDREAQRLCKIKVTRD